MKEITRTSRCTGYLEKIFRAVNSYYFGNQLEEPVICITSTVRAYGHVTVGKAWSVGKAAEQRRELNISSAYLATRPIENVVCTMVHECVHLWNLQNGVKDCCRGGTYHNKKFRDLAEAVDLKVTFNERYGWSQTEPTDALIDFILEQGWNEIPMNRNDGISIRGTGGAGANSGSIPKPPKKPSSTRKYLCPCCGKSVRATRELRILCMDCDEQMIVTM